MPCVRSRGGPRRIARWTQINRWITSDGRRPVRIRIRPHVPVTPRVHARRRPGDKRATHPRATTRMLRSPGAGARSPRFGFGPAIIRPPPVRATNSLVNLLFYASGARVALYTWHKVPRSISVNLFAAAAARRPTDQIQAMVRCGLRGEGSSISLPGRLRPRALRGARRVRAASTKPSSAPRRRKADDDRDGGGRSRAGRASAQRVPAVAARAPDRGACRRRAGLRAR